MLDRASTFAHPKLLELLQTRFVPVAIDQAYERRQKDAKGEFYRRFAGQGPRKDFRGTTQGFYVTTAGGELLLYNNNRHPSKVARLVGDALQRFEGDAEKREPAAPIADGKPDPRWNPGPPDGGFVVRVHTKVLGGYPEPKNDWDRILQSALGRDNLWVTRAEHAALVAGDLPKSLLVRLARFHLVDNTRGEPPMWREDELHALEVGREDERISGTVRLATKDGARTFDAAVLGFVSIEEDRLTRFDLVAEGRFAGEGRYTRGAPPGHFPLAVSFTLADGTDLADAVPPQGSRGWLDGYLK